jgi:hypothetical protein
MKFRATVELGGKTATGIEVPEAVVAALGSGRRATRLAKTVESRRAGKQAR